MKDLTAASGARAAKPDARAAVSNSDRLSLIMARTIREGPAGVEAPETAIRRGRLRKGRSNDDLG